MVKYKYTLKQYQDIICNMNQVEFMLYNRSNTLHYKALHSLRIQRDVIKQLTIDLQKVTSIFAKRAIEDTILDYKKELHEFHEAVKLTKKHKQIMLNKEYSDEMYTDMRQRLIDIFINDKFVDAMLNNLYDATNKINDKSEEVVCIEEHYPKTIADMLDFVYHKILIKDFKNESII